MGVRCRLQKWSCLWVYKAALCAGAFVWRKGRGGLIWLKEVEALDSPHGSSTSKCYLPRASAQPKFTLPIRTTQQHWSYQCSVNYLITSLHLIK